MESSSPSKPEHPEQPPASSAADSAPAGLAGFSAPEPGLPEWQPLTPEILEDEAIRGDFVLRWAVVGLALLLGCTQITDARVLVHARTGQYLAAHGFLPSPVDPFSLTTEGRRWVNLHWLFDLIVGAVDLAGPVALSLAQGVLAALTFGLLVHTVRPGIRTWWGSISGALALLTAAAQLELRPELITLLGVACLLWVVVASEQPGKRRTLWLLPGVMWLWAQCDSRAWVGLWLVGLYLLGHVVGRRQRTDGTQLSDVAWPCLAAAAIMSLHPFLWETWLAAWSQYAIEYPALRQSYPRPAADDIWWYPLWSEAVWNHPGHRLAAALFLAAAAFAALGLNRERAPASHWCLFLGGNLLALFAVHELAAASLVNCVLATVHGQEWYRARFGQVYSVGWLEVLFSRGGRAITVLGLFLLAVLSVSGRLDTSGRRTGLGLTRELANDLETYRQLGSLAFNDRGFHFTLRQGDALIAAGRRSFVDHRVALFAGRGAGDWLSKHRQARRLFRPLMPPPLSLEDRDAIQGMLQDLRISHVLPRLNSYSSGPDYSTFMDLVANPDWMLTDLLPTTAVFHRSQPEDPEERRFVNEHELDVIRRAFQDALPLLVEPQEPARPPTFTQQLFLTQRQDLAAGTLEASHWLRLGEALRSAPPPFHLGCCTLSVRAARRGVAATPDLAEAHRILGEAYQLLGQIEALALDNSQAQATTSLRYFEAIAAARQAATLQPNEVQNQALLVELWQSAGKVDCTHDALTRLLALLPPPESATSAERQQIQSLSSLRDRLASILADVQAQSDAALAQNQNRLEVAASCHRAGCVQLAVKLLQDDGVLLEREPLARHLLTLWLAELGAGEELIESAERLEFVGPQLGTTPWQDPVGYAALSRGDYDTAITAWRTALQASRTSQMQALLYTSPMTTSSPVWLGSIPFPVAHLSAVQESVQLHAVPVAWIAFRLAACEIERGDVEEAAAALQSVLQASPDSPLRPLCRAYWYCLKDELLDVEPPHDQIPVTPELFAPDP